MKEILDMKRVHDKMAKKRQLERENRVNQKELLRQKGLEMKKREKRYL